jgi:FHS family Na+ dependent glucose MFS transporter 1
MSKCPKGGVCVFQGWALGQMGPSLLDLQIITDTDLKEASALFTSHAVGNMVGAIVTGALYDRYNPNLVLFITILGNAAFTAIIPWCSPYILMIAVHFVAGVFRMGFDAGTCTIGTTRPFPSSEITYYRRR